VPSDHCKGYIITRIGEPRLLKYFGGAVRLTEMVLLSLTFYQAYMPTHAPKPGVPIFYLVMVRS
jgi:hypothetical protein